MKKTRTPIPPEVAALVQHESIRTCCVCQVPGKPYQIHHIDENPSNNDPSNLALLCLDHHNETQLKGGFGRKLDAHQIRLFKDEWIATVRERKKRASDRFIEAMTEVIGHQQSHVDPNITNNRAGRLGQLFSTTDPTNFVRAIPRIVELSFDLINQQADLSTFGMVTSSNEQCGVLEEIWIYFMTIRQSDERRNSQAISEMLDRYQQVTSQIFWEIEFPDGNSEFGGSIRFLNAAHDRFEQMSNLLLDSVKCIFRDEYGGVTESYSDWKNEYFNAIAGGSTATT